MLALNQRRQLNEETHQLLESKFFVTLLDNISVENLKTRILPYSGLFVKMFKLSKNCWDKKALLTLNQTMGQINPH